MKNIILASFLVCLVSNTYADVFRKIDPTTGHITLTNIQPRSIQEQNKQDLTIQNLPKPKIVNAIANRDIVSTNNFPKLTPEIQKSRDSERKRILEDELKNEHAAFKDASDKKASLDVLSRHKVNIAALEREIANVK